METSVMKELSKRYNSKFSSSARTNSKSFIRIPDIRIFVIARKAVQFNT